jgi:hypothetical protein
MTAMRDVNDWGAIVKTISRAEEWINQVKRDAQHLVLPCK